jgi:hypothetical protein
MSINPYEPKIWFKGTEYLSPCFLEEIIIDYYNKKIFGLVKSKDNIQIRMPFDWNDPNIIMRSSDQEE